MDAKQNKAIETMVGELRASVGEALISVLLHGAEARGDHFSAARDLYLLIVLRDLTPATLRTLREPVARWLKKGHPMPRLFCPETIASSADAFPIELLDISHHKRVLHGSDPFGEIAVDKQHLRLQCERELREKIMRLQEAYVEWRGRSADLERLLVDSYLAFTDVFRGCLRLLDLEVPSKATDVVAALCGQVDLEPAPFVAIDQLARGSSSTADLDTLFTSYYKELLKAVHIVDRFGGQTS
jgi:hypothetical protein